MSVKNICLCPNSEYVHSPPERKEKKGSVFALDKNQETSNIALNFFKKASQDHKIKMIIAPALESLNNLNYEKHNYYFFAADPTNPGYHSFAKSLSEHKRNARKFHNYLNSKGIKK